MSTPRRRGAVRNEHTRLAILEAASTLLARDGYDHLTIEGIAAEAGVGKPTIYRWWSTKSDLIAECLLDRTLLPDSFIPADTGDLVADLTAWFEEIHAFLAAERNVDLIKSLIVAGISNQDVSDQLAQRLGATPHALGNRLRKAVESGELVADAPIRPIGGAFVGLVMFRILNGYAAGPGEIREFVTSVLGGLQPRDGD